jgi:DNA-binding NtrC family response regulator
VPFVVHVLLVDDEQEFLAYTAKRLQARGLSVETAACAEAALERLECGGVHVVVLDVAMPGMDGHEFFRQIRARFPQLETIILTGHGTAQDAFEAGRGGVFEYLPKPCDIETLNDVIRKACQYRLVRGDSDAEPNVS